MESQVFNPYLPEWEYVPDGEPHVFGDRVYVYGSHDRFGAPIFSVEDYVCWSAPVDDLSQWRYEGVIYHKRQEPHRAGIGLLFAPDVTQGPDGRYYLFYGFDVSSLMGVAVCDEPAGEYQFLAHVSWPDGTPYGRSGHDGFPFDPAVLVDDDGRVWLYSGFRTHIPSLVTGGKRNKSEGAYVLELEQDMHTIRGEEKLLLPLEGTGAARGHGFFEASSIRKYDGRYIFVYSSEVNHELCYATSDRPDGGFEYGGVLVSIGDVGLPGHPDQEHASNYLGNTHGGLLRLGSIEEGWRYYIFYHRQTNRSSYARQACAEKLQVAEDGSFLQAEVTSCGLNEGPLVGIGTYPARIACNLWSREGAGRIDGVAVHHRLANHPYLTQEGSGRSARQYIAHMRNGAVAGFKYFDLSGTVHIDVEFRGAGTGRFVVADSEDFSHVLGTIDLSPTEGAWIWHGADFVGRGGACSALFFRYEGEGSVNFRTLRLS